MKPYSQLLRGAALVLLGAAAALPVVTAPSSAQEPDEPCTVSILNQSARVRPDGSWTLPNVPVNMGPVRARMSCVGETPRSGSSERFTLTANRMNGFPEIAFGDSAPIPVRLAAVISADRLTSPGEIAQLTATAVFADGSAGDVTPAGSGTLYNSTNPRVATVSADGQVTAVASGRVLVTILHEAILAAVVVEVVVSGDTDGDGIPDDLEVALGLDPNNPADAFADLDRDGLTNLEESQLGTDPRNPDTDGDTLRDGDEGGYGTNPLLFDTDGDGFSDGLEIRFGSDPLDPNDFNLAALASISVAPPSFHLVFNTVMTEASVKLKVTGTLIDGTKIDVTSRATTYASSDLSVCSFGSEPGRVFAGASGACTITATNNGFTAQATGTVSTFSPVALSQISLPGSTYNVDVAGDFAYVAAGAAGLQVVNVSNRLSPFIAGAADTAGNAQDVQVVNGRAYVADGAAGLAIFDLGSPGAPVLLGTLDTLGDAQDVEVRGNLAYLAAGTEGLQIIDVANPAAAQLLGSVGALGSLGTFSGVDVDADTRIAVAAAGSRGLRVIDVSVPSSPVLLGTASLGGNARDVVLRGSFAYVADLSRSLTAVNLSDPSRPVATASTPAATGGLLQDVEQIGDLLFGADIFFVNGVPIINVAVPATPVPTAILDFRSFGDDNGTGIAADQQFVYLTTDRSRLMIGQYLSLQDNEGVPPTVAITSPTGTETPLAGTPLEVTVEANDDVAVAQVDFLVNGAVVSTDFTRPYSLSLTVPSGVTALTLGARAVDFGNNVGVAEEVTLTVLPDEQAPVIGTVTPADGTALTSGDAVVLSAAASDNVAVSAVTFRLGSRTYVAMTAPYEITISTPPVVAATNLPYRVEAVDPSGNLATVERTLPVSPVADTAAPQATFLTPGDGDAVLPGADVTVSFQIIDDHFIDAYTLTLDGEVVASRSLIEQPTFTDQLVLTIPADAVAGQTFTLRLETSDFASNSSVTQAAMVVISADQVLTGNRNLDSSYNGRSLALGTGTFTVIEPLSLQALTLLTGARVVGVAGQTLNLSVTGELRINAGASIDVSGLGYGPNQTYPGATLPGSESAGSHLGHGGGNGDSLSSTFGSVYRPRESGGGGQDPNYGSRGGGVVRIVAQNVTLAGSTSAIRANGVTVSGSQCCKRGGAAGSVWITAAGIGGDGSIEARGGDGTNSRGSGGGGAVAIEYGASTGTVLGNLRTFGGATGSTSGSRGGAGTVYLHGGAATYGDLVVDNGTVSGVSTELPAFGSGAAQAGSAGTLLETGRPSVPAYFAGHWLEVRSAGGALKGTWRIAAITGGRLTLAADVDGVAPEVSPGDLFQGVYRFDNVTMRGTVPVVSGDPIRVSGMQEIAGRIEVRAITAGTLVLRSGAVLTHPVTSNPTSPESLQIALSSDLVLEPGASIDVSGLGYSPNQTYPGATLPGSESAGSHLGHGGGNGDSLSSTFGSVYRPRESGGGGQDPNYGSRGGGVVRIVAQNVTLAGSTSAIRANGVTVGGSQCCKRGGAGGSVWITAAGIGGDGSIEARGGDGTNSRGSGGGGAVAIEYGASTGTVLGNLSTFGGAAGSTSGSRGGAGTVYLFDSTATYGDLVVDNNGVTGQTTELPALGSGIARVGSTGSLLVTDRITNIPAYFVGHWLRLSSAGGTLKGMYRVTAVSGLTATLSAADGSLVDVVEGDLWQGLYRFDSVTTRGAAVLATVDAVETVTPFTAESSLEIASSRELPTENREAPSIDPSAIAITRSDIPGTWHIEVPPAAVVDPDSISEIRLGGRRSWTTTKFSPQTGATFTWLGSAGESLELVAIDAHELLQLGASTRLAPLPETGWLVAAEALPKDEPQPRLAGANGYLLAAYTDRLVVADPTTQESWTVRFAGGETFVDLEVDDSRALLTLRCGTGTGEVGDDEESICHFEVPLTDNLWELRHWPEK